MTGKNENDFEGTQADLGTDLLEPTRTSEQEFPASSNYADPDDALKSARILFTEGLVEEAKKVLWAILHKDSKYLPAKKALDEIHEQELKQIFGETEQRKTPKDRKLAEEEAVDGLIGELEKELELTRIKDGEFSLFDNPESMEIFSARLEYELADGSVRNRIDIGIAFLEMGLYELAERQFESASKAAIQGANPDIQARFAAFNLLAYTLIISNKAFKAFLLVSDVLEDSELNSDERLDFLYLMGRACEGMDKYQDALRWFKQVSEIDVDYRDVRMRSEVCSKKINC